MADNLDLGGDSIMEGEFLPFDRDAIDPEAVPPGVPRGSFLYVGEGLTAQQFTNYVEHYDFGPTPPDYVVLHHTAIPSLRRARYSSGTVWDDGDEGRPLAQVKARRLAMVVQMRDYYQSELGWDRGPHLFIDDRWIWLFSPMREEGIHARWGNSLRRDGKYHYAIGIEVIGYYESTKWPPEVARLVGHAVAVLKKRLGTFELRYMYPEPNSKPGCVRAGTDAEGNPIWKCARPERLAWGGIASHRDYNKPGCPGAAISEDYYVQVLQDGWKRLTGGGPRPGPVITNETPILRPSSGEKERVAAYLRAQLPPDSEYKPYDIETIVGHYWTYAPPIGLDPFIAVLQCIYETKALQSEWAARPHRNPARIGVTGAPGEGVSFPDWATAVRAHLGRLLAYAVPVRTETPEQRSLIDEALSFRPLPTDRHGIAANVGALGVNWANDAEYAAKLTRIAAEIYQVQP